MDISLIDDVYISVIPADRTSVDYGKRFNISFIFVAFVPTFEVLLNGDVIVNSSSLIRDPSINDQIYNYSINSLSLNEGLYVARRSINQGKLMYHINIDTFSNIFF